MDNIDNVIENVMQKQIYEPQEFEQVILTALENKKHHKIHSNIIIKIISSITAFITIMAGVVFAKDISNWVNNIFHPFQNKENIANVSKISELIPKNVTKIILINNLSNKNSPTTYQITDVDMMEKFMNLFTKTYWNEDTSQRPVNFDGAFWEIHIEGEFECVLYMQGIGGNNNCYGKVKIVSKDSEKYYEITRDMYMEILAFTEKKYYLHDSNLELPLQEKCYIAQEKILEGLTESEKEKLQKNIRLIHIKLEYELVDAVRLIKDKNSPYWEDFTNYGTFTDPFTETKVDNGGRLLYVLDEFAKIKDITKNEQAKIDLQECYNMLKEGMEEHNLEKCFEAHKVIHDYDYFAINIPVHLETPPTDWSGVSTYFGTISIMQ